MIEFRWNETNIDHIAEHGISRADAEYLIGAAKPPFPRKIGDGKYLVRGRTFFGEYIQAIFVLDADRTVYVIHARLLADHEKRQLRREQR